MAIKRARRSARESASRGHAVSQVVVSTSGPGRKRGAPRCSRGPRRRADGAPPSRSCGAARRSSAGGCRTAPHRTDACDIAVHVLPRRRGDHGRGSSTTPCRASVAGSVTVHLRIRRVATPERRCSDIKTSTDLRHRGSGSVAGRRALSSEPQQQLQARQSARGALSACVVPHAYGRVAATRTLATGRLSRLKTANTLWETGATEAGRRNREAGKKPCGGRFPEARGIQAGPAHHHGPSAAHLPPSGIRHESLSATH